MKIILTRQARHNQEFAQALQERGDRQLPLLFSPLQDVIPGKPPELRREEALILTSSNALACWPEGNFPSGIGVFCVGERTALEAAALGLNPLYIAKDVSSLLEVLYEKLPAYRGQHKFSGVHYLRGEEIRMDICGALQAHGFPARETITYSMLPQRLSDAAKAALQSGDALILPIFSAKSAGRLMREYTELSLSPGLPHHFVLISSALIGALLPPPGPLFISETPDGPAMLELTLDISARLERQAWSS